MTEHEGRRDRKKRATRRAIQDAALRLALELGPDRLTVEAISDAADVSPRTFFNYFGSKGAALAPARFWTADRLADELLAQPADATALRALRAVFRRMAADVTTDLDRLRLWRTLAADYPERVERLVGSDETRVAALAEALARRAGIDPDEHVYPLVVAWAAWGAARAAVQRWLDRAIVEGSAPPPVERYVDEAFDLLERGL